MGLKDKIESNAVVWFLGAIVVAFGAGIGAYEFVVRVAGLEVVPRAETNALRSQLNDVQSADVTQKKQVRFLSLYLRYTLANTPLFQADDKAARAALDDYMTKFIDDADKSESTVAVGKGHGTQVTITFPDGSSWPVPPDFRGATMD